MNRRIWVIILSIALLISIGINARLAFLSKETFDDFYKLLASQHLTNSRALDMLNHNNVAEAQAILKKEVEEKGTLLAVCLMNSCSEAAKDEMAKAKVP